MVVLMVAGNGSGERQRLSADDIARARLLRESGLTFAEVGAVLRQEGRAVTTQQVWQVVIQNGGDPIHDDGRGSSAARFAARWGASVRKVFEETRDPGETARQLSLAERAVRRFLGDHDLLHLALPAGSDHLRSRRWEPKDMEELIRSAATEAGEPLSLSKYERWAAGSDLDAPSQRTITVHYGSWKRACRAAGVRPGDSSRDYLPGVTAEECFAAVAEYVDECARGGARATLTGYEQVSAARGWPCRNTVLLRCGGGSHATWRSVIRRVMAESGGGLEKSGTGSLGAVSAQTG